MAELTEGLSAESAVARDWAVTSDINAGKRREE